MKKDSNKPENIQKDEDCYTEIIATPDMGYVTYKEYIEEMAPYPSMTEEDFLKEEEWEKSLSQDHLNAKDRMDMIKNKVLNGAKRFFYRLKPQKENRDRNIDMDR